MRFMEAQNKRAVWSSQVHAKCWLACTCQDFEEEQGLVARLIHRLRSDDPGQHYALLQAARKRLSAGGAQRLRHTLPPIAFAALDIVRRLAAAGAASGEPSQKEVCCPFDQFFFWQPVALCRSLKPAVTSSKTPKEQEPAYDTQVLGQRWIRVLGPKVEIPLFAHTGAPVRPWLCSAAGRGRRECRDGAAALPDGGPLRIGARASGAHCLRVL